MNDLFDIVSGGDISPASIPEPAVIDPADDKKNQVLAEEAAAEPEELTIAKTEVEPVEESDDASSENATEDDTPSAASEPASIATSQPAQQKPANVVEEDVYEFDKCLITVAMGLMPEDGNPNGRLVMLGVRNHQDEPIFSISRLNDLLPLPDPIQQLIEKLKEELPARSEKAAAKKAKAAEAKKKASGTPKTVSIPKIAPKKADKPKPTSMNLFDMFDQKS